MPEIKNPNLQTQGSSGGGGGDMRSTMAFMLLVLAVFLGYQYFFAKPKPEQQPPAQTQSQTQSQPATPAARPRPARRSRPRRPRGPPCATPQISASAETGITVENEFYKIVFTNRGGQVKHWILKKYFDSAGKPLDMVQPQASALFGLPLSFFTYEPALTTQLNQALYQVTVAGAQPTATGLVLAPAAVTFHYAANGIDALKTFRFDSSTSSPSRPRSSRTARRSARLSSGPPAWATWKSSSSRGCSASQVRTPSLLCLVDRRQGGYRSSRPR